MRYDPSGVPPTRYFLDESGHGGDLASSIDLDFAGQPVFALACVGIPDEAGLEDELERLRSRFRCGNGEIKSSALGSRLPAFASELTSWLIERRAAVFVELVEKRYFVAIHVVNNLLCASCGLEEVNQTVRSSIAELIVGPDFEGVLLGYLRACRSQSLEDVSSVLDDLWGTADRSEHDIARAVQVLAILARDRTREADVSVEDFLRIADRGPAGRAVWMLSIAIDPLVPAGPLAESLKELQRTYPDLPVSFSAERIGGSERRLREGDVSLAFCLLLPAVPDDVEAHPVLKLPLVPVVAAGHPLSRLDRAIERADLEDHIQLVLSDTLGPDGPSYGIVSPRVWRFGDLGRRLDFLLAGLGWCKMPLPTVATFLEDGRLIRLDLSDRASVCSDVLTVYAAHLRDRPLGRGGTHLLQEVRRRADLLSATDALG